LLIAVFFRSEGVNRADNDDMRLCAPIVMLCVLPLLAEAGEPAGWRRHVAKPAAAARAESRVEPVAAVGESPEPAAWTLADFRALAESRHPVLRIASARIAEALGDQRQARLWPNPVVGYSGEEMGNRGTAGMQGGFIRQRIITANKLELAAEVAAGRVSEREHLARAARVQVISGVQVRFYDALVAEQRVELTSQLARLGTELARATEMLVKAKQVSVNGLLQSQIAEEQALALQENAVNELAEARRLLALSVGVRDLVVGPLEGRVTADLPDMTWADCRRRVFDGHPGLAAARARLVTAGREVTRQERKMIPDLDVRVGRAYMHVSDSDVTSVMLGVGLPIFDRNQGGISRSEAEAVRARFEVERLEVNLQLRAATAYREYSNARHQARRYATKILPKAHKSIELVRSGYTNGQVRSLELLAAHQKYVEVNLAYLATIRRLRESATVIESQLLIAGLHGHRRPIGPQAGSR
jgi:cobalt-zinc-cadmium efflux system outer membrane protein